MINYHAYYLASPKHLLLSISILLVLLFCSAESASILRVKSSLLLKNSARKGFLVPRNHYRGRPNTNNPPTLLPSSNILKSKHPSQLRALICFATYQPSNLPERQVVEAGSNLDGALPYDINSVPFGSNFQASLDYFCTGMERSLFFTDTRSPPNPARPYGSLFIGGGVVFNVETGLATLTSHNFADGIVALRLDEQEGKYRVVAALGSSVETGKIQLAVQPGDLFLVGSGWIMRALMHIDPAKYVNEYFEALDGQATTELGDEKSQRSMISLCQAVSVRPFDYFHGPKEVKKLNVPDEKANIEEVLKFMCIQTVFKPAIKPSKQEQSTPVVDASGSPLLPLTGFPEPLPREVEQQLDDAEDEQLPLLQSCHTKPKQQDSPAKAKPRVRKPPAFALGVMAIVETTDPGSNLNDAHGLDPVQSRIQVNQALGV